MKTIVVANQKGGSGKSTLAVHLAAAAEQAGDGPVVISDTDPQGTAADWFAVADLILIPLNPTPADLRSLVKGLPLVKQSGAPFQFVLARVRANLKNNEGTAMA